MGKHKPKRIRFNQRKFDAAVFYILAKSTADRSMTPAKLNAILFQCDMRTYRDTVKPMAGATYRAFREGPRADQLTASLLRLLRRMMRGEVVPCEQRKDASHG